MSFQYHEVLRGQYNAQFSQMKDKSLFSFTRELRRQHNVAMMAHGEGTDMQREWHPNALIAYWTMLPHDRNPLGNKSGPTRLGFAVLLKYFSIKGVSLNTPVRCQLGS
jgi:hypothetical protein